MKLRLSFSLLSTWERGEIDRAIQLYFHMKSPTTPQMEDGRVIHGDIASHIGTHKTFPEGLPQWKLAAPECEKAVVVPYNDMFDLKVIYDCVDSTNLYEFKTGTTPVLEYVGSYQIPLYFLAAELEGLLYRKAYVIQWNQYTKRCETIQIWNSPRLVNKARNYIETLGPEIYEFFTKEGLL